MLGKNLKDNGVKHSLQWKNIQNNECPGSYLTDYFAGTERASHEAMWDGNFPNHIKIKMQGYP